MDYQQIGRQIRAARLRRKMTQAQLAEAADLSVPYISHVERGKKRVSLDALLRISQAVDVTVDQLLSGTQPQDTQVTVNGEILYDRIDIVRQSGNIKSFKLCQYIF